MPSTYTGTENTGGGQPSYLYGNATRGGTSGDPDSFTIEGAAGHIARTGSSWGAGATVSFSFRATAPTTMPDDTSGFSQFNAAQISATLLALQAWSDVANINFTRVGSGTGSSAYSDNASILFSNYNDGADGAAAFAYLAPYRANGGTGAGDVQGDVWVNSTLSYNQTPVLNGYGRDVLIHEIGHALGLSHPGDYDAGEGDPSYSDADYREDSRQYTVMSYWSEGNTGANFGGVYAAAPMLDDIAAIQLLYGANMSTRTGDTTYGFNSNAGRDFYSATSSSSKLVFSIWDAGGYDTLDVSGYSNSQVIDLRPGEFSSVGGLTYNVSIAQGAFIEHAIGGSGRDTMYASAHGDPVDVADISKAQSTANTSRGSAVSLEGHFGLQYDANIVSSTSIPHATVNAVSAGGLDYYAVTVRAGQQITIDVDSTGGFDAWATLLTSSGSRVAYDDDGPMDAGSGAPQDSFLTYSFTSSGTYYIAIGQFPDSGLSGDPLAAGTRYTLNVSLTGEPAPVGELTGSYLEGRGGDDVLYGSAGGDTLDGGTGDNFMAGGDGDDSYISINPNDRIDEAADGGRDLVTVSYSYTLGANIENARMTGRDSLDLTGNGQANILKGNGGNNVIKGGGGSDKMYGNGGSDKFYVNSKNDRVIEEEGKGKDLVYSTISYTLPDNVEKLTLTGGRATDGWGNALNNVIIGNDQNNKITGLDGADILVGKGGADTFIWNATTESRLNAADTINDLQDGADWLDLSRIDGDTTRSGVQGFDIVDHFTGHAGELVLSYDASTDVTALMVDVNGDGQADMRVNLLGDHESFDRFIFGG